MADNGRMQHMKEVLRKCNISVLTESEFSKTYTNIRREHHQGRPNYSGYKTGLSQELNHSNQILKSLKLEESIENEPLGLSKKRMYLNELKQSIAAFKQSNSVLQSDSHVLALYLKKSEMLQNDCDARLGANILEMEVPICKLIIRLLRSYEALAQEGDCLKAEKEQLALALKSTESKLQISEQRLKVYSKDQAKPSSHSGKHNGRGTSPEKNFRKFKEDEKSKTIFQRIELNEQEIKHAEEKRLMEKQIEDTQKNLQKSEVDKLKLQEAIQCKSFQLKGLGLSNAKLEEENRLIRGALEEKNEALKQMNQALQKYREMTRYRELWMMASEELQHNKRAREEEQSELVKLVKKYRIVKERLSNFMENKYVEIPEDCGRERQDLQTILDSVKRWSGFTRSALVGLNPQQVEKMLSTDVSPLQKSLEDVQVALPSFYVFLEHHEERIIFEMKNIGTKSISSEFFLRMRAILDSKFNDYWYGEGGWKRLPDFAAGFLDKFNVDRTYKKVERIAISPDACENIKVNFFLDLFNPKLKDVWQCEMFRRFLMQRQGEDELYFFLSCRNYLFGGSLLENSIYSSDPIVFVTIEKAVKTVEHILSRYDRTVLERIKFGIQMKKKRKNNRYYIDSHFLLKVLLDIYSSEKARRLQFYETALSGLESRVKQGAKSITFNNFKRFMSVNYPFITICELAEMYRQCYNISRGEVTYKVIFAKASEKLFVDQLKANPILPPMKGYNLGPLKDRIRTIGMVFEDCRYLNRQMYELGLEPAVKAIEASRNFTCLTSENEYNAGNILQVWRQLAPLQWLLMLEMLRKCDAAPIHELIERHIHSTFQAQTEQLSALIGINQLREKSNIAVKSAAVKLSTIFKKKLQQVLKTFEEDVNRKLKKLLPNND